MVETIVAWVFLLAFGVVDCIIVWMLYQRLQEAYERKRQFDARTAPRPFRTFNQLIVADVSSFFNGVFDSFFCTRCLR